MSNMEAQELVLEGRKYKALVSPDEQQGAFIIIGPPEGLMEELGLQEPFATRLHNILYDRGILSYADAVKPKALLGALQDAYNIDIQKIVEEFHNFEKVTV